MTITMKAKFFRSNTIAFGTHSGSVVDPNQTQVTGTLGWTTD